MTSAVDNPNRINRRRPFRKSSISDRFLEAVSGSDSLTIVAHDNPDPDAIAAGWALRELIEAKMTRTIPLVAGGAIVRSENRRFLELLDPPLELVDDLSDRCAGDAILVDCGPNAANHLLGRGTLQPIAVIDHHRTAGSPMLPFVDIRPDAAASSSIVAGYLKEQGVPIGERLATALVYAIRSETRGKATHHTRLDRACVSWLSQVANPTWLAEIESAPLSRAYYRDFATALENTRLYGRSAFCLLPRAEGPETVGEVADLLIRCDAVDRVFCGAVFDGDVLVSVRTKNESDVAAELIRETLKGLGSSGGHAFRAGGKVAGFGYRENSSKLNRELLRRWLAACDEQDSPAVPLVECMNDVSGDIASSE